MLPLRDIRSFSDCHHATSQTAEHLEGKCPPITRFCMRELVDAYDWLVLLGLTETSRPESAAGFPLLVSMDGCLISGKHSDEYFPPGDT